MKKKEKKQCIPGLRQNDVYICNATDSLSQADRRSLPRLEGSNLKSVPPPLPLLHRQEKTKHPGFMGKVLMRI